MSEIIPRIEFRRNEFGEPKRVHILQAGEIAELPKSNDVFFHGDQAIVENNIVIPFRYVDDRVFNVSMTALESIVQILEYVSEDAEFVKFQYMSGPPIEIDLPDPIIVAPQPIIIKLSLMKQIRKWFKLRKLTRNRKRENRKNKLKKEKPKKIDKYLDILDQQFTDWNSKEKKL